jgi:prolyl-tRNA synthetase
MKDAYSFPPDSESLSETYQNMYAAYQQIFLVALDYKSRR